MKYGFLYPANWYELAFVCKEVAGWCCEHCGIAHGTPAIARSGHLYIVYLAAAHLDHDPWNPSPRLAALCPTCHGRYDWEDLERKRWLELEIVRHQILVQKFLQQQQ